LNKYGVDVYDPLEKFTHVRSIELKNTKPDSDSLNKKPDTSINLATLERACFITNGAELLINLPSDVHKNSSPEIRVFDLSTGYLLSKTKHTLKCNTWTFDCEKNFIWGITDVAEKNQKFNNFFRIDNKMIQENFKYPKSSNLYKPCQDSEII
jgi:hypothetical protein